jgi:glycerate kinase
MARSSGLALLDVDQLDPRSTTTYGVGELILAALNAGHRKMIIGIGGSATNDGGAGMAQALGFQLLDKNGADIKPGGGALSDLHNIDTKHADHRLQETDVIVACDVNNPLTGPTGASAIFGPQKGATPAMVKELDIALAHFANVVEKDLGVDIRHRAGAGAAGGLGGGLTAFVNAEMRAGVDIVLEAVRLGEKLDGADLVITGEGQFDRSTIFNKAPVGVAKMAKEKGVPVIGIAGSLAEGFSEVHDHGIDAVFTLVNGPTTLEKAMEGTHALVASTTEEVLRAMLA